MERKLIVIDLGDGRGIQMYEDEARARGLLVEAKEEKPEETKEIKPDETKAEATAKPRSKPKTAGK